LRNDFGSDYPRRSGPVVDDDLLFPAFSELFGDYSAKYIRAAAGRVGHDHPN
jgi:hypothetical protein